MSSFAHSPRLALAALFLGATAIGLSPIFVRLSEIGPIATAFHRLLWSLPVLGAWFAWERRRATTAPSGVAGHGAAAFGGLLLAIDLSLWHWSITITTVANATLLANFAAVFVTLAGWLFWRERVRALFLAGLTVALAGAALLMGQSVRIDGARFLGDALGLLTAVFYAGYLLVVARLRAGGMSTARVMFASSLASCAALLPIALIAGEGVIPESAYGWTILIALGTICHAAGQGLIAYALAHLGATFGSVALLWQPCAAALLAWVMLGESLGAWQAVGATVVLVGIVMARAGTE